jgi:recombination protein RecT
MIPYNDKRRGISLATFVPGWKGLIDLVNRAGRASAWTGAVRDGDSFDYGQGDRPFVRHKPADDNDDAPLLYVYAVGRVKGSDWPVVEVWPMAKVWRHRDKYNKVGDWHYSYAHPEMYARKIVLLQVLKYLPQSVELARAVEFASAADSGEGMTIDGDFAAVADESPPFQPPGEDPPPTDEQN